MGDIREHLGRFVRRFVMSRSKSVIALVRRSQLSDLMLLAFLTIFNPYIRLFSALFFFKTIWEAVVASY